VAEERGVHDVRVSFEMVGSHGAGCDCDPDQRGCRRRPGVPCLVALVHAECQRIWFWACRDDPFGY
jgi:hypothetical protein